VAFEELIRPIFIENIKIVGLPVKGSGTQELTFF
jgi:hypothetical protein